MRVLVTGSAGRVGRAIYVALAAAGHAVSGIDATPSSTSEHVGDFADPTLLAGALEGVDAVVHTAALHAPHVPHLPETAFRRVNVDGTRRLLEAASAAGVRRIVFTSTTALYGAAATPAGASFFNSMNTARSGGSVVPSSTWVVPFRVVDRLPTSVVLRRSVPSVAVITRPPRV